VSRGSHQTSRPRVLARLAPATAPHTPAAVGGAITARPPVLLPGPAAAELVHVLGGLAVALAGT
jgi:hypothetical protein